MQSVDTNVDTLAPMGIRPLRRAEYDRLVAAGAFEGERVELVRGRLIRMSPQGPVHFAVVQRLIKALYAPLTDRATVISQSPVALLDDEPEPDVAVVPLAVDFYESGLPTAPYLVIEVSDSTIKYDQTVKARLYAEAGVPEYWLVDVRARRVLVHRGPGAEGYASVAEAGEGDALAVPGFEDVRVELALVLPGR
jgi:Uma2 family endonuclease